MKSHKVSSLVPQRWAFAILGSAAIVTATMCWSAQNVRHAKREKITFEQTGYFYGEEQFYVVKPPIIHVYDAIWDEKPEVYRHEVFRIKQGKWVKTLRKPTGKPKLFLAEKLCDTDNHLDVPSGPLRNALPAGVHIKDIEDHSDYAIAVYSDTPTQTEWYSLKASLLRRNERNTWSTAETIYAGDARHYCGREEFPVFTNPGEEAFVFLLYTGETSIEDRSFTDIQSFLVRKRLFR